MFSKKMLRSLKNWQHLSYSRYSGIFSRHKGTYRRQQRSEHGKMQTDHDNKLFNTSTHYSQGLGFNTKYTRFSDVLSVRFLHVTIRKRTSDRTDATETSEVITKEVMPQNVTTDCKVQQVSNVESVKELAESKTVQLTGTDENGEVLTNTMENKTVFSADLIDCVEPMKDLAENQIKSATYVNDCDKPIKDREGKRADVNTWAEPSKGTEENKHTVHVLEPIKDTSENSLTHTKHVKPFKDKQNSHRKNRRSSEKNDQMSKVDAFVKDRFYNIQKTAEHMKVSHLNLARQKGEITEEEYEEKLKQNTDNVAQVNIESLNIQKDSHLIPSKTQSVTTKPYVSITQLNLTGEPESIVRRLVKESDNKGELVPANTEFHDLEVIEDEDNLPLTVPVPKLQHLAPLVNENEVLRNLVKIGVDLSCVEKSGVAGKVIRLNFKSDVKPLLLFLHDLGVPGNGVSHILSRYTSLLPMGLDRFKTRITYLKSKKFSNAAIVEMMTKSPQFLALSSIQLDQSLGFLQKSFWLTGDEVRKLATMAPKLITRDPYDIQSKVYLFQEELGFTKREVKQIVLTYASVFYKCAPERLVQSFSYLHDVMLIPRSELLEFPEAMRKDHQFIATRHRFLEKLGRAQYNPELPNYVPLKKILTTKDPEFSCDVAKASLAEYNEFLRTV